MLTEHTRMEKMLSLEWLGQTIASACWIVSVFVYSNGALPSTAGDWLQLAAASSWMTANVATVLSIKR
ncbi:MAG: hypothetical protein CMA63_08560 [Euryarchaeota archaeon]|nr:hypothetical protein [Euryarchaeota archaeon]|tara:strand:- start:32 stop:235 length:204 start_codon:yes stop_codon:yes gene_type:complete